MKRVSIVFIFSLVFTFSAGFVDAESNPVLNFFGGQSGLLVEEEVIEEYEEYEVVDKSGNPVGGFLDFIANLFGFTTQSADDTSSTDTEYTWSTESTVADTTATESNEYAGPDPTLTCLPNTVVPDEPVLLFWQCLDASQTASASGFSTGGRSYGGTQVNPSESAIYSLSCSAGSYSECSVNVINPAIGITADRESVPIWEKVNISWSTVDVQSCVLSSDDDSSKYENWKRHGACDASDPCTALSHPITKTTIFTLTCTTDTGLEKERAITVTVQ